MVQFKKKGNLAKIKFVKITAFVDYAMKGYLDDAQTKKRTMFELESKYHTIVKKRCLFTGIS